MSKVTSYFGRADDYNAKGIAWQVIGGLERFAAGYEECARKRSYYRYVRWTRKAETALLVNAAPRIGRLSSVSYMGCGFHYEKVTSLAACLKFVQERDQRNICMQIVTAVRVEGLFCDIKRAEASIQA